MGRGTGGEAAGGACRTAAAVGALLVLLGALPGCGRKLLPIAPGAYPPPAVKNLAFELQEDVLTLFWTAPAVRSEKEGQAVGFRVLRARQSTSEAQCTTCSVSYQVAGEVPVGGPSERLRFQERLEPGYTYRYKIIAYSADGLESRESAVVRPTE